MKKIFKHVGALLMILPALTACGSYQTVSAPEESSTNAISVMDSDNADYKTDEKADDSSAMEDIKSEEMELSENEWKDLYLDFIERDPNFENEEYGLIYINEDDIPELVIRDNGDNSAIYITSSVNGVDILETQEVALARDRENLLEKRDYKDYSVLTTIYQISDGKWEKLHDFVYVDAYGEGTDFSCSIDGVNVESGEFDAKHEELFSWTGAEAWNKGATYDQLHAYLGNEGEDDYRSAFRRMIEDGEFCTEFTGKPFDKYVCLDLGNDGSMELIGAKKNTEYDIEIGIATYKDGLASKVYSCDMTDDMLIVDIDKSTLFRVVLAARHIDYCLYSIHDGSSYICYSIEGEATSGAPSDEPYSFELNPDEAGFYVNGIYKPHEEGIRYLDDVTNSFSSNLRLIALHDFSNEFVPDNISTIDFTDLESALQ